MKNRILSIFLVLVFILSFGTATFAKTGNEKIDWLVQKKFVVGDENGELNLNKNLTREEAATIIVKALGKDSLAPAYQSIEDVFKDMNSKVWSNGMVNVGVQEKIISGFPDKTFGPKKNITYQELITMLVQVKGGLTAEELKKSPWPGPYILKANELKILDSTMVNLDHKKAATRLMAFEMLYNTLYEENNEGLNNFKAMVREVSRVYGLDKDEMGITLFNDKNNSKEYGHNYYTRIKFNNISNVEDLLGKVINIKIDENNNLKEYKVDNSYEYLMGKVEFMKDSLKLNGKTYDILFKDSSTKVNDQLQFVYHNDKEIDYNSLYTKVDSDFARITVDKNKVIAIESFDFSNVEPIAKVDGNRVIFTDNSNTSVDEAILIQDNTLKSINISDIKALDIGHVYGENKILITRGSSNGTLDNILSSNGKEILVRIDGKNYAVSNKFNMAYSTNGNDFITLDAKKVYDDLYSIKGELVQFSLDVSGNIKYIIGTKKTNEGFYIVDKALVKDIRLIDKDGKVVEFETTLKSSIKNVQGNTITLSSLNKGDLVYLVKDGNGVKNLYLVKDFSSLKKDSILVDKDSQGKFILDKKYALSKDLNSFLFYEDNKGIKDIQAVEVNKVLENTKATANLKAYIISDYDFDNLKVGNKVITSGNKNTINTIIFTGFEQTLNQSKEEIVKLKYRFRPSYDTGIEGIVGDKTVVYKIEKNTLLKEMSADDYVRLFINNNNEIIGAEVLFTNYKDYVEVTNVESSNGKLIQITVKENGKDKLYWIAKDYEEIGFVGKGSFVKLDFNNDGDVNVILVK